jgi:hypothetical protein
VPFSEVWGAIGNPRDDRSHPLKRSSHLQKVYGFAAPTSSWLELRSTAEARAQLSFQTLVELDR